MVNIHDVALEVAPVNHLLSQMNTDDFRYESF